MASATEPPVRTKTLEEFQQEIRSKLIAAIAASIVAGFGAAIVGVWGYIKTLPGNVGLVPPNAIMAFWSKADIDQSTACPVGWELLREGIGRTIVGAGTTDASWRQYIEGNVDGNGGPNGQLQSFTQRKPQTVGGEERHQLKIAEMPTHNHGGTTSDSDQAGMLVASGGEKSGQFYEGGGYPLQTTPHHHVVTAEGGGKDHNLMPPYIAFYFCRKA